MYIYTYIYIYTHTYIRMQVYAYLAMPGWLFKTEDSGQGRAGMWWSS